MRFSCILIIHLPSFCQCAPFRFYRAIVVCAWGAEGAAAGRAEEIITQSASRPDQIVDTLGAGDTFNASFIYSQIEGMDWKKGLEFACLVAGCKVGQKGFQGIAEFKQTLLDSGAYPGAHKDEKGPAETTTRS